MRNWFRPKPAPPPVRTYQTPSGDRSLLYADMLRQPHLLVAGATGSGKSVVLNALVYTALFCAPGASADCVEFILIDPKRVELADYAALPHTLVHATEPPQIRQALSTAMTICENRYRAMQTRAARKYPGGDLYVIIDEFADMRLLMPDTLKTVQRLAQIGRAAKIHIVLATQTPIAKVLPTEIKCNFDARLGLRTRSAQDSRNIIGRNGCEILPRYGTGWYLTPEEETLYTIPYYPENLLRDRVQWWMRQKCHT